MAGKSWVAMLILVGAGAAAVAASSLIRAQSQTAEPPDDANRLSLAQLTIDVETRTAEASVTFPVLINKPTGPPVIEVNDPSFPALQGTVSCSVCHSMREPNLSNRAPSDLDEFHQNMTFAHAEMSCFSCHNPDDYDTLRLADQQSIPYTEVMQLCAQCHGPKARDYAHGAHGGMNGYWDLTRGPRTRNNCVDCHDPHIPAFPKMQPTFKPRDRFLTPTHSTEGAHD